LIARSVDGELTPQDADAVVFDSEAKGLGEAARAGGDGAAPGRRIKAPMGAHDLDAAKGFGGTEEHGGPDSLGLADDVRAGMDSVTLVGV